jgi:hypothetical protein
MPRYRVEAMKRNALGFNQRFDALEFEARDVDDARNAADKWLREKGFDSTTISGARIVSGDLIVAEKEVGLSRWSDGKG